MNRQSIRSWPALLRIAAEIVAPTGQHRARPHAAVVDQDFAYCAQCKETVPVTVHGDLLVCSAGHRIGGWA